MELKSVTKVLLRHSILWNGATAECTMHLAEGSYHSVGIEDGLLKDSIKGDAWFESIECCADLAARGKKPCLQVKTNHRLFLKALIEDTLRDALGGVHIVLEGILPNGEKLVAAGYH